MALTMMIFTYFVAKRRNYPAGTSRSPAAAESFAEAFPPLMAPVLIIRGHPDGSVYTYRGCGGGCIVRFWPQLLHLPRTAPSMKSRG